MAYTLKGESSRPLRRLQIDTKNRADQLAVMEKLRKSGRDGDGGDLIDVRCPSIIVGWTSANPNLLYAYSREYLDTCTRISSEQFLKSEISYYIDDNDVLDGYRIDTALVEKNIADELARHEKWRDS